MSSQAAIKRIRGLHRKKERISSGLAIAQGGKLVRELLESDMSLIELHVRADQQELLQGLTGVDMDIANQEELDKMATMQTGVSAVAVFEQPDYGALLPEEGEVYLACDAVADPGNLGTIIRSAENFGITGVVLGLETVDLFNPKCVQATMGSLFRVPTFRMDLFELNAVDVSIYKAELEGQSLYDVEMGSPAIVVVGNETHGVTEEFKEATAITIPITGDAESLNVGMAATVIAAELYRRELS